MTRMRNLPSIAGAIIWARQIKRQLLTVFDAWLHNINRRSMSVDGRESIRDCPFELRRRVLVIRGRLSQSPTMH